MNCQRESPIDVIDEIKPLLELHWREIAHFQDIPLSPNYAFYVTAPCVRLFTARDEGRLIGYGVFFVSFNQHYQTSKQAVQDILFVHPEYRGSRAGFRLINFCDDALRQEGCQVVYQHVKDAHDFSALLEHIGYAPVERIYARRLDIKE